MCVFLFLDYFETMLSLKIICMLNCFFDREYRVNERSIELLCCPCCCCCCWIFSKFSLDIYIDKIMMQLDKMGCKLK